MDWDDLRVFLALSRAGSVAGAAATLGVSRSTVGRRVAALEEAMNTTLIERAGGAIRMTAAGELLGEQAERVEGEVLACERQVAGRDVALQGPLRVSVVDVASVLLAPAFALLKARYPDIELELRSSDELANLHRRETDLAIRVALEPPSPDLFGRRLGHMEYAIFGHRDVVGLDNPPWILWDETRGAAATRALAESRSRPLRVAATVDRMHLMLDLAVAGMGLALLPVALARRRPELVPVGEVPQPGQGVDLWVLTHPDLRRTARLRVAMGLIGELAADAITP
ncbi:MAG: LysR family transcriptional regulator [Myxococcota bacterium]